MLAVPVTSPIRLALSLLALVQMLMVIQFGYVTLQKLQKRAKHVSFSFIHYDSFYYNIYFSVRSVVERINRLLLKR